jgi:hypothetical protein
MFQDQIIAQKMATFEHDFEEAIATFEKQATAKEKAQFALTTLEDVEAVVIDIQTKIGPQWSSRRLQPFLEAMQQYADAISMFCNTSTLPILCYIWGPMKFILQVRRA